MPPTRARRSSFHSLQDLLRQENGDDQDPTKIENNGQNTPTPLDPQQSSPKMPLTFHRLDTSQSTPIQPSPNRQHGSSAPSLFTPATPITTTPTTLPAIHPPVTHDIGSCAPCALSLLFTELLTQEVITESNHSNLYKIPLQIFLDHFRLYYDQPADLTLNKIKKLLINCNCDSIQWILSPIFRLMLISILNATKQPSTDGFFSDESFYSSPLWPKKIHDLVSEESIKESMKIMQTANRHDRPLDLSPIYHIAHHCSHFSQEDLLTLTKFLHIKTMIHHECLAANHMHDLKSAVQTQCQLHLHQQAHYFTNTFLSYATIHIHHTTFIFDRSTGIQGHFDLVACDPLLQLPYSHISSCAKPSLDTTRSLTQIAHHSPALLFQELQTLFPQQSAIFLLFSPVKSADSFPQKKQEHLSTISLNTADISKNLSINNSLTTSSSQLATHISGQNSTAGQTSASRTSRQLFLLSLQSLMTNTRSYFTPLAGSQLPDLDENSDEDDDLVTITFGHG